MIITVIRNTVLRIKNIYKNIKKLDLILNKNYINLITFLNKKDEFNITNGADRQDFLNI